MLAKVWSSAFPGGAEIGDVLLSQSFDKVGGFGEVVVILLGDMMKEVLDSGQKGFRQGVAVADDGLRHESVSQRRHPS